MNLTRSNVVLICIVWALLMGLGALATHAAPPADAGEPAPTVPLPEDPVADDEDPIGVAKKIYDAIRSGEYVVALGLVLVLLVSILRYAAKRIEWFETTLGKWILAFAVAVFVTLGTALAAGEAITFALIANGLGAGFAAAGIYQATKDVRERPIPPPSAPSPT